jgi:hypothetical protein
VKSCVAIDPSINNLGIAIFIDDVLETYDLVHPSPNVSKEDFMARSRDVMMTVRHVFNRVKAMKPDLMLVTEVPEHFGVSGYVARETGSVFKLAFVCGMVYGITDDTIGFQPSKWKGQMTKEIVRNRLVLRYPDKPIESLDHNIVDAIGIGHKYIFGTV